MLRGYYDYPVSVADHQIALADEHIADADRLAQPSDGVTVLDGATNANAIGKDREGSGG